MYAASNRVRCCLTGWLGVIVLLCPSFVQAQQKKRFPPELVCGCPDGRQFAVGASMYGKSSARVLITGLRPDPAASARGGLPRCTDVLVLGQVVRLLRAADGRPFLERESLKRGAIRNVCRTKIHFIEAKKSYDFFAEDGSAVALTDRDVGPPQAADSNSAPGPEPQEVGFADDLTGKDLLQLLRQTGTFSQDTRPGDSTFDEEDLKEGAYFVVRRRSKAAFADTGGVAVAQSAAGSRPKDVTVHAGTLGRIEKRAGAQSEPLWVVELLPDSAPAPFWRSLIPSPRGETRTLMSKAVLASSQIAEINHFFDQYGVEWTRFGEARALAGTEQARETSQLPEIYGRPKLSLDENMVTAHEAGMLDSIREAALGLLLVLKDSRMLARQGMLVLDESPDGSRGVIAPDLLHRQCFVGLDRLANSGQPPTGVTPGATLAVTSVDVRAFQPGQSVQVPRDYYAIDLELLLKPNFSSEQVPLVCRFPSGPIDVGLVDVAERILSSRFEIRRRQ